MIREVMLVDDRRQLRRSEERILLDNLGEGLSPLVEDDELNMTKEDLEDMAAISPIPEEERAQYEEDVDVGSNPKLLVPDIRRNPPASDSGNASIVHQDELLQALAFTREPGGVFEEEHTDFYGPESGISSINNSVDSMDYPITNTLSEENKQAHDMAVGEDGVEYPPEGYQKSSGQTKGSGSNHSRRLPVGSKGDSRTSMRSSVVDVLSAKASQSIKRGSQAATQGLLKGGQSIAAGAKEASSNIVKGSKVVGDTIKNTVSLDNLKSEGARISRTAQYVGKTVVTSAGAVVPALLVRQEGTPRNAGFVVFKSLLATQSAIQMVHHPKPYTMDIVPAPDPGDIFWRNVGLPNRSLRTGRLLSLTATSLLCFFWSVPMAFISSLTEVNSLKETLPEFGAWIEDHPRVEPLLAQAAPLLLLFFNETILPGVLKTFAKWEGFVSSAMLEASLFLKLGCFMVRSIRTGDRNSS